MKTTLASTVGAYLSCPASDAVSPAATDTHHVGGRRPYRLERVGSAWDTVTFSTEAMARAALHNYVAIHCRPGDTWRITLRAPKGRKTTLIAEGTVQ